MSYVFCLIIFLGFNQPADTLIQNNLGYGQLKKLGNKSLKNNAYNLTISYYEQALIKKFNKKLAYQLIELYEKSRKYNKALNLSKKLYELNPDKNIEALYHYAINAQNSGDEYMSDKSLKIFYKNSSKEGIQGKMKKQAKALMAFFNENEGHSKTPENKLTDDNSLKNNLISYRQEEQKYYYSDIEIIIDNEDFYPLTQTSEHIDFADRILFREDFHNNLLSQQTILLPENNRLYFLLPNKLGKLAAFYINVNNIKEGKVIAIYDNILNEDNSSIASLTFGIDSKSGNSIMYFSSNREDGRGKYDIWYSKWNIRNNAFTTPKNLGGKINSSANELTHVYLPKEKELYFSSDRIPGYGGYDLYSTIGESRAWVTPTLLPINSTADDYFISKRNNEWYFYSNRWDKSEINWTKDKLIAFTGFKTKTLVVTGNVKLDTSIVLPHFLKERLNAIGLYDTKTNINALLYIKDDNDRALKAKQTVSIPDTYTFTINPDFNYALNIHDGYGTIDSFNISKQEIQNIDTLKIRDILISRLLPDSIVTPIHYEFNQTRLTSAMKEQIDSLILPLLNIFPDAGIKINAHTDSIGSYAYNIKLSKKRAKTIYQHILNSINYSPDNIEFEGYGYTKPIAPNINPDGTDNPQGRKLNRRAEVIFIREL